METTQTVPLTLAENGVIRVTGSRVTLDSIVQQFKQGASPEQIQEDYPSLTLGTIYAVIAYYLQHTASVEEYLHRQHVETQDIRHEIESRVDTSELRERLRQRRAQFVK